MIARLGAITFHSQECFRSRYVSRPIVSPSRRPESVQTASPTRLIYPSGYTPDLSTNARQCGIPTRGGTPRRGRGHPTDRPETVKLRQQTLGRATAPPVAVATAGIRVT